jgi:large subunit ribosomal protein L17
VQDHQEVDDLVKIEGIGPKVAKVLEMAGIKTFEGLAHAEISSIQKMLDAAGMQMMNPEGWIDQAKLAAKGDWAALEKLQSELKGGRKVNP